MTRPRKSAKKRFGGAVIVLEGWFNPAIFTPAWFVANQLVDWEQVKGFDAVSDEEGDLSLYTDFELSRFETDRFAVEARRDRITFATTPLNPGYEELGQLVVDVFDILIHTPVKAVALSRAEHVALPVKRWKALAAQLAPPDPWTELVTNPELSTITIRGHSRSEKKGSLELVVEPSKLVVNGVYLVATRHFDLAGDEEEDEARGAREAITVIGNHWREWLNEADSTVNGILDLV